MFYSPYFPFDVPPGFLQVLQLIVLPSGAEHAFDGVAPVEGEVFDEVDELDTILVPIVLGVDGVTHSSPP